MASVDSTTTNAAVDRFAQDDREPATEMTDATEPPPSRRLQMRVMRTVLGIVRWAPDDDSARQTIRS